jgi:hypothetical protein
MQITKGKVLSLLVSAGYFIAAIILYLQGAPVAIIFGCFAVLLPLSLIWFPDELGNFTGFIGYGEYVDSKTPSFIISCAGWFFLVVFPIIFYLALTYG